MQFRQGMLGVAVVAVALATAILGSWVMSLDIEEKQVTRFNELTEITTLFDSDLVPTFTDYNPSDNYVGYFTDATTIDGVRYFGGVDYGEAVRANNFKLNLPPIERSANNLTLPTDGTFDARQFWLWMNDGQQSGYANTDRVEASYLRDIIAQVTSQTSGTFRMASNEGMFSGYRSGNLDLGWVVFTNESDWFGNFGKTFYAATPGFFQHSSSVTDRYHLPYLSAIADLDRGIVTLYTDNQYRDRALDISIDSCVVAYGGGPNISGRGIQLQTSADYVFELFPPNTYMDPSKGVELE